MIETPGLRRTRRLATFIASSLFVATPFAVAAETTVYVWTGKDGVVSYSQDPPPAGQAFTTREIATGSLTPAQRAAVKSQLARSGAQETAEAASFRKELAAADRRIVDAVRRLTDAERALSTGREPQPGERAGIAGGGSRLREEYFGRQRQLEVEVQAARTGLEAAYRARSELTP
jgi:hypothetical protein